MSSGLKGFTLPWGGGFYLLPDTGKTVVHVNAHDLALGTARVGPAWTKHGTVPFVNGGLTAPSGVGVFSTSNYYSQPSSSLANMASPPFTLVMVINPTTLPSPVPFATSEYGQAGFILQIDSSHFYMYVGTGAVTVTASPGLVTGQLNVLICGMDSSGNIYAQVNGGSCAITAGASLGGASSYGPTIGVDPTFSNTPLSGTVQELAISTDVPSAVAFAAIYASVLSRLFQANRYLIPQTSNVLVHVNATDLQNGTYKAGGAWTKAGTVVFNAADYPTPSVGPFSSVNNFTQPLTSVANVSSGPWTMALVVRATNSGGLQVPFGTGNLGADQGAVLELNGSGGNISCMPSGVASGTVGAAGTLAVLLAGLDASGNLFYQWNGGTVGTATGAAAGKATIDLITIGAYPGGGLAFNGVIYELMVSTDVPSSAAFTALYNTIVANGG